MKYGARNQIRAKVKSVKTGDIMSLVKFEVIGPVEMASVLTYRVGCGNAAQDRVRRSA